MPSRGGTVLRALRHRNYRLFFTGQSMSLVGAPVTVAGGGATCVLGARMFRSRLPALREIVIPPYRERGILPEVARGLDDAPSLRGVS